MYDDYRWHNLSAETTRKVVAVWLKTSELRKEDYTELRKGPSSLLENFNEQQEPDYFHKRK